MNFLIQVTTRYKYKIYYISFTFVVCFIFDLHVNFEPVDQILKINTLDSFFC